MASGESLLPDRDLTGKRLGDFVVRRRLGEGGQGVVWLADQPGLGREVVIKVVRAGGGANGSAAASDSALSEAQTASRLDHPYAAHVYAAAREPEGLLWIAMEYVHGTPLDQVVAVEPMPLERFVPFFERLCEVVHAAHELGIVHRDIKPSNVMVMARSGRLLPKLLDFGIARLREASSEQGAGHDAGSPPYMAPERWLDRGAGDARGDIYALGVLAHEVLTGRLPFSGGTLAELARAHATATPPPLGDGFPRALDEALARALAKKPEDRFASALDLAAAVAAVAGEERASPLSQLPEAIRREALERAPQPIAEAVAALEAARNPHQASAALASVADQLARWVGLLALASASRVGASTSRGAPDVVELVRALRRRELNRGEWLQLARELCRPFARRAEAHPLPELVTCLYARDGEARGAAGALEALAAHIDHQGSAAALPDARARDQLAAAMQPLARALEQLAFLGGYPLALPKGRLGELWIGVRRPERLATIVRGTPLPAGRPVLLDAEGGPVLNLWPLAQARPPMPGAAPELFLLAGGGLRGARLDAPPRGYEEHDEEVWGWLGALIGDGADAEPGERATEEKPPYRGLDAFAAGDASHYFGREREAQAFVNRLKGQGFLAVVGPSGAGKSSFVHAGVAALLPAEWPVATLRPGARPLAALRATLERSRPQLLVVDQFEELFTLCHDAAERQAFAAELIALTDAAEPATRVVITLRDDFLLRAEQLAPLRQRLGPGLQLLATPAEEDLLRILVEPARLAGYQFEDPALPREMVAEVADQPGALAILSFTAARLWEVRDRHFKLLRRRAYEGLGGVGGALTRHAEATLLAMTPEQQRLVREAFRHLVTAEGTRAVLSRAELLQLLAGGARAEAVVEKLVGARLLVSSEAAGGEDQVEVVHEALLGAWPRLVGWRREDAEGARLRDQLRAAARQWHERGRPRGLLWRDDALAEYRLWRARHPGALTDVESAFVEASRAAETRGRRIVRGTVAGVVAILVAGLATVLVLNSRNRAAKLVAEAARAEAVHSADDARRRLLRLYEEQGRQQLLAGEPERALAFLLEAYAGGEPSPSLRFMIARAAGLLRRSPLDLPAGGELFVVAVRADDSLVATGDGQGGTKLWDADTGELRCSHQTELRVARLDFAPAAPLLAITGLAGKATIIDTATCKVVVELADEGYMETARFSPDGRLIVTAANATPKLWDAASGKLVRELVGHEAPVQQAVFSADGKLLATGGEDKAVRVWEVESGRLRWTLLGHQARISALAFSPDGTHLASGASGMRTGDKDFDLRLWDVGRGELVTSLIGHTGHILTLEYDASGARLVSASMDGTARIWDAHEGKPLAVLQHRAAVGSATLSPRGDAVLTTCYDGSAALWTAPGGEAVATLLGHHGIVRRGAYFSDGRRVVTASYDGHAKIWSPGSDFKRALPLLSGPIGFASPSADGGKLLTLAHGRLELFEIATGRSLARLERTDAIVALLAGDGARVLTVIGTRLALLDARLQPLRDLEPAPADVTAVCFSGGGKSVAAASASGVISIWDADTGAISRTLRTAESTLIWGLAPLPGGRELAAGTHDGEIEVWALDGDRPRLTLRAHDAPISLLDTCAGGPLAVSVAGGRNARVWDLERGTLLAELEAHTEPIQTAEFSHDCAFLVTGGLDGARVWLVREGRELFVLRQRGVKLAQFNADDTEVITGDDDVVLRFWDTTLETRQPIEVNKDLGCLTRYRVAEDRLVVEATPASCPDTR